MFFLKKDRRSFWSFS